MKGIYVHIPFCKRKCNYCDFCSYPLGKDIQTKYLNALIKEAGLYKNDKICADTLYFGGGTPSLIDTDSLSSVLDNMHSFFCISEKSEKTIEVNPCTIDEQKAKDLFSLGFNRVSIGAQSFLNDELKILGRLHTKEDTVRCFEILREAGFKNISLDLMYALPSQTMKSLEQSIDGILKLAPEHISCYGLKIEEGTVFKKMLNDGTLKEKTDDEYADMYELICSCLKENGYIQYELSNFSLPSKESKHNLKYWQNKEYIGLGASASSLYNKRRYTNTIDLDDYIKSFEKIEDTHLSKKEQMSEYMFLSLRLTKLGAEKKEFERRFGQTIESAFPDAIKKHAENGLLINLPDRYILAERAYYVSNSVLCDFV